MQWAAHKRLVAQGRIDDARSLFIEKFGPGHELMLHAADLAEVLDDRDRASGILRTALANAHDQLSRSRVADCAALVGDVDLTFEAMRQAFVESRGLMMIELWHPIHRGLWPDPRFKQILVDLGLAAYWRLSGEWGDFARPLGGADFELVG